MSASTQPPENIEVAESIDAQLPENIEVAESIDAQLSENIEVAESIDAQLLENIEMAESIDAQLSENIEATESIDTQLSENTQLAESIDVAAPESSASKLPGNTKSAKERLRLKYMKLAGFKSFVDPTTVPFLSNLVGVVGPNGCGKSNIIDGARWVMGESSAKSLRAEAGTDVIFNGSTERKPAGQASVELVFDNPHGAIGGEYASYNEISIKRVIGRDSQSNYYLNNRPCRRKDITDLFLGTGLGPRSYSIIEQGMISKLIEAKPDELRIYLEEAAGISKYKERRRETENRMRHTRDNLDRLNDIREELDKQLARLERQAQAAEKYKEYKKEERTLKSQLMALRWKILTEQTQSLTSTIQKFQVELEAEIATQRSADAQIENLRETHHDAQDNFHQIQEQFYGLGGQIGRIEQTISHQKERQLQLTQDFEEASSNLEQITLILTEDEQAIQQYEHQLADFLPQLELIDAQFAETQEKLVNAEELMQNWQQHWDDFNSQAAKASETAQVEQTRIQNFDQRIASNRQRISKLNEEYERLAAQLSDTETVMLTEKLTQLQQTDHAKQEAISNIQASIKDIREELKSSQETLSQRVGERQTLQGRQASLDALQQAALGKNDQALAQWLETHHLTNKPRLAQDLQVESGWELAVETVLGDYLQAIRIDEIASITNLLKDIESGNLCFVSATQSQGTGHTQDMPSLASKIKTKGLMEDCLNGIYIADDLNQALLRHASLGAHESIITADGIWLGSHWIKVNKGQDASKGVLQREQELQQLTETLNFTHQQIGQYQEKIDSLQEQLQEYEHQLEVGQAEQREINQQLASVQADLKIKSSRQEQVKHRLEQIAQERDEIEKSIEQTQKELNQVRETWQEALHLMEQQADTREILHAEKEQLRSQLDEAKTQVRQYKDQQHELSIKVNAIRAESSAKKETLQRLKGQREQILTRFETLQQQLQASDNPIEDYQLQLEELLSQRVAVEETLSSARARLEEINEQVSSHEDARQQAQEQAELLRTQIQDLKMRWQEQQVRANTITEQLQQDEENLEILLATMPEQANEQEWDANLTVVSQRIARLGAINLAAIDEYQTELERKTFLDKQYEDLAQALTTLENAIQKIDKETRATFKDTFEIVNAHFQKLFPKVFGGGSAYLELTGEDLLDTGVSVMARPPGKKNSTIHLLSGGEKALTAIALVFSIFQLNPAPFCLLDEVDAPLDDANVSRYCNLIKEMSSQVQFIFISHNKVAMEMAQQLTGVTMKEPGVSRMVSVDIEEAIAMAEV